MRESTCAKLSLHLESKKFFPISKINQFLKFLDLGNKKKKIKKMMQWQLTSEFWRLIQSMIRLVKLLIPFEVLLEMQKNLA